MSYVKNYNVGQINVDLLNTISFNQPPFVQYTHELPLLSFGDVQHSMNLSLVFNYERYRDEKPNSTNPFFIAPGFKLNLQKRLIYNQNNIPTAFQGENGRIIDLKAFGNTYTFNDDSQRILRNAQSTITVESSDFSKETYNAAGRITAVYDKYSDSAILSYTYNSSGQLTSVIFRGSKEVKLSYSSNRLSSISYNGKTTYFAYKDDGALNYVQHYNDVKYTFTLTKPTFSAFDVDFKCEASATENNATVSYSKNLYLVNESNNYVYKVNVTDTIASNAVNTVTYRFPRTITLEKESFKYVDIIDNNGAVTRVQIRDNKILCSYELPNGEPQFEVKSIDAASRYLGNVALHNGTVASLNNRDSGIQTINDGVPMNYYTSGNSHCWSSNIVNANERKGYYTISGWIKSNVDYVYSEAVYIGNSATTNNRYEIFLEPNKKWHYFSITVYIEANTVYLRANETIANVSLRDVRLTYQRPDNLAKGNLHNTTMSDYVLINGSEEIAFNDVKFYCSVNGTNREIKNDDGNTNVVTFSDVMRYKLRKKKTGTTDEVYYNDCKNVIPGATDLKALVDEAANQYISINNLDIGIRVCSKEQKALTKYSIDENNQNSYIVKTCTVTKQSGTSYTTSGTVFTETLDTNLDVLISTSENVTTQYVRNSQGLVTRESVSGLYTRDTTYTDALITVKDTDPSTGATIATIKYYLNSTWGGITKIEMPDGSIVTDTYDEDMSFLTGRAFGNATTRQHNFGYSNGRLASMTNGTINYGFTYSANTGDIACITKNGIDVENHTYSRSNGETTVNSNYPSSGNAIHTKTKLFDKYGRLKSVTGVLGVSYDLNPFWFYSDNNGNIHTTMESYNRSTHGELNHSTKGVYCKDVLLSQITDSLSGEVIRYGYDNGKLTAAVTGDTSNNINRQETFVYDSADRVIKTRFDYNLTANNYVTSDITYVKTASDPMADGRVGTYSYKFCGTEKAKTVNAFDTYKRLTKKTYTVGGKSFTKSIEYDKTKVKKVVDSAGGTTQFEYDAMGRISNEKDGSGNILKSYTYDSYGQLIRENNKDLDKTFIYEYNNNGGITKVKKYAYTTSSTPSGTATETAYTYNSTSPDRLASCGSESITYNSLGCPTTYNGYTTTWTRGKLSKLARGAISTGTYTYSYTYNALGQRIGAKYIYLRGVSSSSSIFMGMLTEYNKVFRYDQSGRLIYESKTSQYYKEGSGTEKKVYLYDETGIIGLVYTSESGTTTTYYFQRNLLGDVVGIYDTSGTKVGGYAYDAWGNCTITLDENGIAFRNPIRYRGYYYDEDTNLYFLNARCYCPAWRRFISPDDTAYLDPESANGLNLYAYCNNDPVNYADPSGHSGIAVTLLISTGIGLVLGLGMEVAKQASEEGKFWDLSTWNRDPSSWNWWEIGKSALVGAATGLAYGFGGVAGGIMKGSFQTLTIAGKALTVSHSVGLLLGGAAIANFAAGVAGYTMHTAGSENESFNILKGLSEGIGQTGKGVLSFLPAECMPAWDFGRLVKMQIIHYIQFLEERSADILPILYRTICSKICFDTVSIYDKDKGEFI